MNPAPSVVDAGKTDAVAPPVRALTRVPLARLARNRRSWWAMFGWALVGIGAAVVARRMGYATGADHTLRGTFGFVIVPLLTYAIVRSTLGGEGLRPSLRGLVTLGAAPRRAAIGALVAATLTSALACGIVAVATAMIAHGPADAPLGSDLPASFLVAFGGGATYAAFFCAGSAIGRGAMRGVFLAVDWLVGAPAGFGAVFVPRGHVMSLLGGGTCFGLSRTMSSVLLVVMFAVYFTLALRLARRVR